MHSEFIEPEQPSHVIGTGVAGRLTPREEPHVTVSPHYLCPAPPLPQPTPTTTLRPRPAGPAAAPPHQPPQPRPQALAEVHQCTRPPDTGEALH